MIAVVTICCVSSTNWEFDVSKFLEKQNLLLSIFIGGLIYRCPQSVTYFWWTLGKLLFLECSISSLFMGFLMNSRFLKADREPMFIREDNSKVFVSLSVFNISDL